MISGLMLVKLDSTRLKKKNIIDFGGIPMFIINLRKCLKIFDKVYVSTDDRRIIKLAQKEGADFIFRDKTLCGDTPNIPVYQHALQFMNGVDGIVAVQANSPNIKSKLIEIAKELLEKGFQEIMTMHEDGSIYGSIWAISTKRLREYGDPYKPKPEVLLLDRSIDIHTEDDFQKAQCQK